MPSILEIARAATRRRAKEMFIIILSKLSTKIHRQWSSRFEFIRKFLFIFSFIRSTFSTLEVGIIIINGASSGV